MNAINATNVTCINDHPPRLSDYANVIQAETPNDVYGLMYVLIIGIILMFISIAIKLRKRPSGVNTKNRNVTDGVVLHIDHD